MDHSSLIRSPWSYAVLFHLGGAVSEVAEGATAYAHRHATHNLNVNAVWVPGQAGGEDEVAWARRFYAAVGPRSMGAYVNFLDHDDHDRVRSAYGTARTAACWCSRSATTPTASSGAPIPARRQLVARRPRLRSVR